MKKILCGALLAFAVSGISCGMRPGRVVLGIGVLSNSLPGVKLAVNEINSQGGIDGVPVEITGPSTDPRLDSYQLPAVLELAKRFAQTRDLLAVIGHSDSASTLSAAAIYNQEKIPQIVTIATNPAITNIGAWTYRLCLSDAAQGPALADYSVKDWGKRRIAVCYVNDEYGSGLARLFEKRALDLGARIVASVIHRNALQADDMALIASTLKRLRQENPPDLVALFQRVSAANWTIRTIREAGITADLLGGDNLAQPGFVGENSTAKEGMRISQFYVPPAGDARAQRFVREFRAANRTDPNYSQAFAYDAVYLLRDAVARGGHSRKGIKDYLDRMIKEKTPVHGVGGVFTLAPDHDARRTLNIVELRGGQLQPVRTLSVD